MRNLITIVETHDVAALVYQVRNSAMAHGMLAGQCEGASGELADALRANGAQPSAVFGEYDAPDPEGHPSTGHTWVELDGMILDPTREKFGDSDLIVPLGSDDACHYREHYLLSDDELDESADHPAR